MKIAVATNDHFTITGHIGRCKSFIIFDINNQEIVSSEIRANSFTHHRTQMHNAANLHDHNDGHNHSHIALIEGLRDCDYILFQGGGQRLIVDLKANNITPVLTSETDAVTAVRKLIKGELKTDDDLICQCH